MQAPRQAEASRAISGQEVAWLGEVLWAWGTPVAPHDEERSRPWSTVDGIVLALAGVPPEKRHATNESSGGAEPPPQLGGTAPPLPPVWNCTIAGAYGAAHA
jgi:hypothetical protein